MLWDMDKDFQKLMEQVYGPLGKKEKEESDRMAKQLVDNAVKEVKMTEIEELKAQIKVLEKKLSFLEELEKTKSPMEEAYKDWYGEYPPISPDADRRDIARWHGFQAGYNAVYGEQVAEEPKKESMSLYERFVNEGAYGMISFENALRVVNDFLLDEGVIEDESGEYITFTLQKSLLEIPND